MKTLTTALTALCLIVASAPCAFAATTKVYNSGLLVIAFLGFCALVVVIQLIPAMVTLFGMIRGLGKKPVVDDARAKA